MANQPLSMEPESSDDRETDVAAAACGGGWFYPQGVSMKSELGLDSLWKPIFRRIVRPVSERVRMGTEPNRIEGGSEGGREEGARGA